MPGPATPAPQRSPLLVALIVAAAFFMETLDSTVILTALPKMAESFDRKPTDLSIGITAYMLMIAVFIPASGWIADRFGTRTVFCWAIGLFTLASIACGMTQDLWSFVAARVFQGIGGALMSPVGRLAVLRTTEKKDLVRSLNLLIVPGLTGMMIGPPIGGLITDTLSWRWIFFLNLPIGIAGVLAVYRFIPNHFGLQKRPFDGAGFLLNGGALASVIYGLALVGGTGPTGIEAVSLLGLGAVLAVLAVRHALSHPHPVLDLSIMRARSFRIANTGGALYRFGTGATHLLMPLMFQVGLDMTPFVSGLMILAHATGDFSATSLVTFVMRRFGYRRMLLWTVAMYSVSISCCALFTPATPLAVIFAVLFISGGIRSITLAGLTSMQYADVGPEGMSAGSTFASVTLQVSRGGGIACAAILLNFTAALRGAPGLELVDFQIAFLVVGLLALASVLWYFQLERNFGAEISGHRNRA